MFYVVYQKVKNGKICVLGETNTATKARKILETHKQLLPQGIYTVVSDVKEKL